MAKADCKFPPVYQCESSGRQNDTVVTDLDGTLLIGRSAFSCFASVAFEAGGILRLLFLLLAAPIAAILYYFVSESAGAHLLIFATFAGLKVTDIESVARHVLPKFYSSDLHPETWRVFFVVWEKMRANGESKDRGGGILKDYLGAHLVLGTELATFEGIATGFVSGIGVLIGENKAKALREAFDSSSMPEIGIGDRETDFPFMKLCKESYIVPAQVGVKPLSYDKLPKPIVFEDGGHFATAKSNCGSSHQYSMDTCGIPLGMCWGPATIVPRKEGKPKQIGGRENMLMKLL